MLSKTMIRYSIEIINLYLPNLWFYLNEAEFQTFLSKAFEHTEKFNGSTPNNNFIVTFFELVNEHKTNSSTAIRSEFGYFNYLLGEFQKFGDTREFKNLLIGALYNFERNNFHHTLGEIAVCLDLSLKMDFRKYEHKLENRKSIDFEFVNNGELILVDVLTIDYDKSRYEKEKFEIFLDGRLKTKFEQKSKDLNLDLSRKIFVFPILSGITIDIIKEQSEYLKKVNSSTIEKDGYQAFSPKAFGNVQGTFFSLFTIDEIIDPELIRKNYNQHGV